MDRARIRRAANHAVKRIDFAHQMALTQAADGRIAAHRANRAEVETHQSRARTHPRRTTGSLNPGVTAADDDDIKGMHDARDRTRAANRQSGFEWGA